MTLGILFFILEAQGVGLSAQKNLAGIIKMPARGMLV